MERSLGFERTIKPANYESLKVSSFIGGISEHLWLNEKFISNLYDLMTVQAYKAIYKEQGLIELLHRNKGNELTHLNELENQLLGFHNSIIQTTVEKE